MRVRLFTSFGLILALTLIPSISLRIQAHPHGLVAAYNFDEAAGTVLTDRSGMGHTGVIAGASWTTAGKFNGALSFEGTNDRVDIADAALLDVTSAMTLEAWVRPASASDWSTVVLKESDDDDLAYALYAHEDVGRPSSWIRGNQVSAEAHGTGPLTVGAWTHLASTFDGSVLRLFVNGSEVASRAFSTPIDESSQPLRIGGNDVWGEYFHGEIDDVRIYARALTAVEIAQDMTTPVAVIDTVAPIVSALTASAVSSTSAVVAWKTDERADSQVAYGLTSNYDTLSPLDTAMVFSHQAALTGLTPGTTYYYRAQSRDGAGNVGASADVTFATPAADAVPPTVVVTGPAGGASVNAVVVISADASDNVGLVGVQFAIDGTYFTSEDTSAPYAVSWNTADVDNGAHILTAMARDLAGNVTVSSAVSVTVSNGTPSQLVAAYAFDETSGTVLGDRSGQGNHGVVSGATWTPAGRWGGGLLFDGIDDVVTIADAPSLDLTEGMTLEAWVKPTDGSDWASVVLKETPTHLSYALYASADVDQPNGWIQDDNGADSVFGNTALTAGAWSHLAVTYDHSSLKLYVNGSLVEIATLGGHIVTSAQPLRIGGNAVWGEYFAGVIDEVRIYRRPLSAAEVLGSRDMPIHAEEPFTVHERTPLPGALGVSVTPIAATFNHPVDQPSVSATTVTLLDIAEETSVPVSLHYDDTTRSVTLVPTAALGAGRQYRVTIVSGSNGVTDTQDVPLAADVTWSFTTAASNAAGAAYAFSEGAGTSTLDATGNGNTGTLSGPSWTTGRIGQGLSFDGLDDRIRVEAAETLDLTTALTLSAWVRPTAIAPWQSIIVRESADGLSYALWLEETGHPQVKIFAGGHWRWVTGASALPVDEWTHLAATYDGTEVLLYVNGIEVGSAAVTGSLAASLRPLWIGASHWGDGFSGRIDEVRVYGRALSAQEIQDGLDDPIDQLSTPVATPAAGTYGQAQSVTLTADAGADIRYTLDGSDPAPTSTLFSDPIAIASTTTVKARAFTAGFPASAILTAHYVIDTTEPPGDATEPPTFGPPGASFVNSVLVTLSTATPDADIYYTTDGSTPTDESLWYDGEIEITETTTIRARAFAAGLDPSEVVAETYTITGPPVLTRPVATPLGGTYTEAQSVTLSSDAGAAIRYTLNGADPTESSPLFAGPIAIATTTFLKARAFQTGFTPSPILLVLYTIGPLPPGGENPPPDPSTVAPPLSDVLLSDFADAHAFLFEGPDPIQRNHTAGSIASERMAVIRGKVTTRDGTPLAGVRIAPKDQPGVGHTATRADGMFDLAVNGGGPVMLDYLRAGFLPVQRSIDVPWKDLAIADDVRLVQLDPVVTQVSFEPQTISIAARGSVSTDDNGSRQATIIVPETGVMVTMHLPDGTMMPGVSQLSIRATEYTVGAGGPEAMPAPLPATSGYTYAVELTADEALQAGATAVTFDPPLPLYVENFLNFPVGVTVPVGSYDRAQSEWIPSDDGRVVGVIGVNAAGEAELDIDGSGQVADAGTLATLGITPGERKRVALLYAPGQSLWRAPIPHFSPHDLNWPSGPPSNAKEPDVEENTDGTGQRSGADGQAQDPNCENGSIIECQNQTLGELLPIAGTPFALAYRSDRVPGYVASRTLSIPLTGDEVPASVKRVDLGVTVAGQQHTFTFAPTPGQTTSFTWDGRDVYGRSLNGQQLARASVSYVYDRVYYVGPPPPAGRSFGLTPPPTALAIPDRSRDEIPLGKDMTFGVETRRPTVAPVGGWYVSAHHRYVPRSQELFMGDGDRRTASGVGDIVDTVAGGGETPVEAGPVPAREAQFDFGTGSVAAADDGSLYVTDGAGILRLTAGLLTRIVSDQVTAVAARGGTIVYASAITQGSCGEGGTTTAVRVSRVASTGPEELALIPVTGFFGCSGGILAISTDGGIYVSTPGAVWAVRPGTSPWKVVDLGDGIFSMAAGPGGSLYIGTSAHVRQWRPDGSLTIIAGNGTLGDSGDGGPAIEAQISVPQAMVADGDGNLVIAASLGLRVVRNGTIQWFAGDQEIFEETPDGVLARQTKIRGVLGLALAPDGNLYFSNNEQFGAVRRLRLPFDATRVPSTDGSSVYEFDVTGRHLRTVDALTGVALLTFTYDAAGRLIAITDRDGLETRINRDGAGAPQSIISPFGVPTTLTIGAGGYLGAVTDAEGRTTTLGYGDGGLLTSLLDANGGTYTFDYDALGRLIRDADPAGGAQDLARSELARGSSVSRDVSDAGTTTYVTQQGANETQTRRIIAPDGTETVSLNRGDGTTIITSPDGTGTTATMAPDPRFGFAAPFAASTTIRTPAGLTMTLAKSRSVTLSDPENPLSVVSHTETTTLNGRVSRSVFDAAARTVTSTSPANRQVVTTLDLLGRPTTVQVGTSMLPTTFTYDASGRLATQTQGARTTTFEYDERGFLNSVTDPLSRTVQFTNDLSGRRLSQTFPDLREATFAYDANGNLTSLTPPGRPAHVMTYTPANLLESYTAPSVGAPTMTQYQFNLAKQPTTMTRADGQSISWLYDAAGRPTTLTTPTGVTTNNYDPATGQLTSLTSPSGGLAYSYDGGLQTAETASGFTAGAVSWSYDASFRVTTERVNDANAITFGYDTDSLLTSAGALTYTRRANDGLLLTATLGTSVTTFTYSAFGELATEESRHGAAVLYSGVYTRDNGGRLAERTQTIGGATTTDAYSYDLAGRLTAVTRGGAPFGSYTYDANGNRTSVTTSTGTIAATYDAQDRILTFGDRTYTYTAHGEVQSWTDASGTTAFTYDVQGNLLAVSLPTGTTVEYAVDARNRRVGRKVNGAVTHGWLYQGQLRPVAELDASGIIVSRFVYGARAVTPEYLIRAGVSYRLITDHLGSVRLVVNTESGAIVQRLDYDAWGQVIADTNPGFQPFAYAGGLFDVATKFTRFGARNYDAMIGRWLAKDPIAFEGRDTNLFAYVGNEPLGHLDPDGTILINVAGGVYGAISGGVSGFITTGTWQGAAIGALSGGAVGALNPIGGLLGTFVGGIAQSIAGQVGGNYLLCEKLTDIDLGLAVASGVGGVLGFRFGQYLASPTRSAFAWQSFKAFGPEPAGLVRTGKGVLEGIGSGLMELAYASPRAFRTAPQR